VRVNRQSRSEGLGREHGARGKIPTGRGGETGRRSKLQGMHTCCDGVNASQLNGTWPLRADPPGWERGTEEVP